MDTPPPKSNIVNRLVAGLKEKTVKLAENKINASFLSTEEVPEESILGFVAAAVLAGAQRLEIRIQGNDLLLTYDGKRMSESDANQLNRGVQSLPELSKGFRLHLGKDEGQIELHLITETSMIAAKYKGFAAPVISQADLGDLQLAKMTTRVILRGAGNYRRVNQAMGNELPEVSLIRKRCFLAPIDIVISGKSIDRYGNLPESLVTGTNFESEHHQTLSTLTSSPSQGLPVDLSSLKGRLPSVRAGLFGVARNAGDAGWYNLVHGIARPMKKVAWMARTWGFLSVKESAAPTQLEADVQLLTRTLTGKLFDGIQDKLSDRADEALSFLEQHRNILSDAGHSQIDQDRVFLKLREQLSPSSDPRVLNNRLELAASLEANGNMEESEKLYAEVLPVWESEALNHFDKYRYEEGAALWQRALSLREKLGTDQSDLANKYLRLAEIGKDQRLGFAEQAYRRCLQLVRTCPEADLQREYKVLEGLAQVLKKNRVLTESLRLAEEAQEKLLKLNEGKETKALVPILKLQGEIYDLQNDYVKSTEFEQKAMLLKFKR